MVKTHTKAENIIEQRIDKTSTLITRNIRVFGKRTSVRLEPDMWDGFEDIYEREDCSDNDLCTLIYMLKNPKTSMTAAIRVFIMLYYKAAATDEGHKHSGHGDFERMLKRANIARSDFARLKKLDEQIDITCLEEALGSYEAFFESDTKSQTMN